MNFLATILVTASLSMDNFAVSLASGCRPNIKNGEIIACGLVFAAAHFIMFSAGWFGAAAFERYIDAYDHWVAFALLLFIGVKMIKESFGKQEGGDLCGVGNKIFFIALATSMDALAVGLSLRFASVNFALAVASMCAFVFVTTFAGFKLGCRLGAKLGAKAEVLGGIILILIGIKVLLDGTL